MWQSIHAWLSGDIGSALPPALLDVAVKATVILLLAGLATRMLRRSAAAARHVIWVLAASSLMVLPVLTMVVPGWQVLPRWMDPQSVTGGGAVTLQGPPAGPAAMPASSGEISSPAPVVGANQVPGDTGAEMVGPEASVSGDFRQQAIGPAMASPLSAGTIVCLVWLVGATGVFVRMFLGVLSLLILGRAAQPVVDEDWIGELEQTRTDLGIRRNVRLLQSRHRTMPMVWGILRPKLLVPAEACGWSVERRRVVLLHELAHIRRWDCLWQLLMQAVCAMYWFHPLAWLAQRAMQVESEQACDDLVLTAGPRASDYAEHILQIASGLRADRLSGAAAIAMARPSGLEGRLLAILDATRSRRGLTRAAMVLAIVLVAGVVLSVAMLKAGQKTITAEEYQLRLRQAAQEDPQMPRLRYVFMPVARERANLMFPYLKPTNTPNAYLEEEQPLKFWYPNGQVVSDEKELLLAKQALENTRSFPPGKPFSEGMIQLWFENPQNDQPSVFIGVFNQQGDRVDSGSVWYNASVSPDWPNLILATCDGSKVSSGTCILMRYSASPWALFGPRFRPESDRIHRLDKWTTVTFEERVHEEDASPYVYAQLRRDRQGGGEFDYKVLETASVESRQIGESAVRSWTDGRPGFDYGIFLPFRLQDIESIQVQMRPLRAVQYKDVSFVPDKRTDAQVKLVKLEQTPPAATQQAGVTDNAPATQPTAEVRLPGGGTVEMGSFAGAATRPAPGENYVLRLNPPLAEGWWEKNVPISFRGGLVVLARESGSIESTSLSAYVLDEGMGVCPLVYGKQIPLKLKVGRDAPSPALEIPSVEFGRKDDIVTCTTEVLCRSSTKPGWEVALEILDVDGHLLANNQMVLFTAKGQETAPRLRSEALMASLPVPDGAEPAGFRVLVRPAREQVISGPAQSQSADAQLPAADEIAHLQQRVELIRQRLAVGKASETELGDAILALSEARLRQAVLAGEPTHVVQTLDEIVQTRRETLKSAQERQRVGKATDRDVFQARSALQEAQLRHAMWRDQPQEALAIMEAIVQNQQQNAESMRELQRVGKIAEDEVTAALARLAEWQALGEKQGLVVELQRQFDRLAAVSRTGQMEKEFERCRDSLAAARRQVYMIAAVLMPNASDVTAAALRDFSRGANAVASQPSEPPQQAQREDHMTTSQADCRLDFRIAPAKSEVSQDVQEHYRRQLAAIGSRLSARGDPYAWFEMQDPNVRGGAITAEYQGRKYMLLCNDPSKVMLMGRSGSAWGLKSASAGADQGNTGWVVDAVLDEPGAARMHDLSGSNLHSQMAMLLNDKVLIAPRIMSVLGSGVRIAGMFPAEQAKAIAETLQLCISKLPATQTAPAAARSGLSVE